MLGVVAGLVGVGFSRILYCDRGRLRLGLARSGVAAPRRRRPGCSACVLLVLPEMYGVGYPVLGDAVAGKYAIGFLLVLLRRQGRWRPA